MTLTETANKVEELLNTNIFLCNHLKYIDCKIDSKNIKHLKSLEAKRRRIKFIQKALILRENTTQEEEEQAEDFVNGLIKAEEKALKKLKLFKNYDDKVLFIKDRNFYLNISKTEQGAEKWILQLEYIKDSAKNAGILEAILGKTGG